MLNFWCAAPETGTRTLAGACGFVIAKTFAVLWLSAAWCFSAAKMGWRQARGEPLNQPSLDDVMRENAMLRAELQRVS